VTAVQLLRADASREQWLARRQHGLGASEIAAVLGISPYDSPFSLWWRKHMGWAADVTEEMAAGTRLEPSIAAWFADANPNLAVRKTGLWQNAERPWQIATPDRLLMPHGRNTLRACTALLECKAAYSWDGWGDEGTDDIPVHYRAQCLWQMDTLGVDVVHVAAFAGLGFRAFLVRRDEKDLVMMREAGRRFMKLLADGEPPDVDEHSATMPILRRINAAIEDRKQEIPGPIATGWLRAKRFKDLAAKVERRYAAELRAHLGTAKTAIYDGRTIAARSTDDKLMRKS
jgi:putative phage-type endonuclease